MYYIIDTAAGHFSAPRSQVTDVACSADVFQEIQMQLREMTRELSRVRRENEIYRHQQTEIPKLTLQVSNLKASLQAEINRPASQMKIKATSLSNNKDSKQMMLDLERTHQLLAQSRAAEAQLREENFNLKTSSNQYEFQCKRIISACCNVSLEQVDEIIGPLLAAVESDKTALDMGEVATFISRLRKVAEN